MNNSVDSPPALPSVYSPTATKPPQETHGVAPAAPASAAAATPSPTLIDIIALVADKADPLLKVVSTTVDRYQKGKERELKFQAHMAWVAISVVFLIIGVSAWLTFLGKIDGSTFTFLLGLIVGYVLTFIRDQIKSPES